MDYEQIFLEHLNLIDRVIRHIARRHHLSPADADEFASVVHLKLVDRDYAILRKFEGRSNLATYLTTVIERLYLDFCIAQWGKWRPSAAARRLGAHAVTLERLMVRDGFSFDEAVTMLQTNHNCTLSREELRAMSRQFPDRVARAVAGDEELAAIAQQAAVTDTTIDRTEDEEIVQRVDAILARAIASLPPRDQLILKLRFENDMKIVDIARLVDVPAKPLYRVLSNIVDDLRETLRRAGIDGSDVARIVGNPAVTLGRLFDSNSTANARGH